MLVADGFVRVQASDGSEFTFTPSFANLARLGEPAEIVRLYVDLHGPRADREAVFILTTLCDQEDPTPAVGWHSLEGESDSLDVEWVDGFLTPESRLVIARHLMQHGMVGKAKPDKPGQATQGKYSAEFNVSEYVAAARVHLGLSRDEALSLSMTEFQNLLEMKYPDTEEKKVPTREEYDQFMKSVKERKRG